MHRINIEFDKKQEFIFTINETTAGFIKGTIDWNDDLEKAYLKISAEIESEEECWYLDDKGNRLEDELLFENSPWSIVTANKRTNIIQRFFNIKTGEAWFATKPFTQLADWLYNE